MAPYVKAAMAVLQKFKTKKEEDSKPLLPILVGGIFSVLFIPAAIIMNIGQNEDGKIDLTPLVTVLQEKSEKFYKDLKEQENGTYDRITIQYTDGESDENFKELICMAAIYTQNDLERDDTTSYLEHLYDESHMTERKESEPYSCSGCKTRTDDDGKEESYCPGTHKDLTITITILRFDDLFSVDYIGGGGITLITGFGMVSAKYEAEGWNPGFISTGVGDHGGVSYGIPQFPTNGNGIGNFINWLKSADPDIYNNNFSGKAVGSAAFKEQWKKLGKKESQKFGQLQMEYAYKVDTMPFVTAVKKRYGIDLNRSWALQELAHARALQYGPGRPGWLGPINQNMSDTEIINTVYDHGLANINNYFSSSKQSVKDGVRNRFKNERKDLLSLVGKTVPTSAGAANPSQSPTETGKPQSTNLPPDVSPSDTPPSLESQDGEWEGWNQNNQDICLAMFQFEGWDDMYVGLAFSGTVGGASGDGGISGGTGEIVQGTGGYPLRNKATITSKFGMRIHPVSGVRKMHNGIDLGVGIGTDVLAVADGTIEVANYSDSAGNWIILDHQNGTESIYMHNSKLLVSVGETVKQGQIIAKSGNTGIGTGAHLHFGMRVNGNYFDPVTFFKN